MPNADRRSDISASRPAVGRPAALGAHGPERSGASGRDLAEGIRRRLSSEVGDEPYRRYFASQTQLQATPGRVEVTAANSFVADLVTRRFADALRRAAAAESQVTPEDIALRVRVDDQAEPAPPAPTAPARAEPNGRSTPNNPSAPSRETEAPRRPSGRSRPRGPRREHKLNEFVTGASNRLAHSAAVEFSRGLGPTSLSPLFIHSSWGLGKTHLLRGIVQEISDRRSGARVLYTTGEMFTNEFIAAVRSGSLDGFRRSLRSLDLLCVDDVHFLSNKSKTQEELLHTFDAIASDGARLVFASDGHPREIAELSEALVSRLMAGMVVRIDPPDENLRRTLVCALADRRKLSLEPAAVEIVASRVARFPSGRGDSDGTGGSVRDIEGMLTQIEAVAKLLPELCPSPGRIGAVLVNRALGLAVTADEAAPTAPVLRRAVRVETIASETCGYLRVDLTEMLGRGRHKRVVLARSMTAHLARQLTNLSYPEIAKAMSRPNHSTVITAHHRVEAQIKDGERVACGSEFDGMMVVEVRDELARRIERAAAGL